MTGTIQIEEILHFRSKSVRIFCISFRYKLRLFLANFFDVDIFQQCYHSYCRIIYFSTIVLRSTKLDVRIFTHNINVVFFVFEILLVNLFRSTTNRNLIKLKKDHSLLLIFVNQIKLNIFYIVVCYYVLNRT